MAEYIDREAAKRMFRNIDAGVKEHITLLTPIEFAELLDEVPAADVAPVRHGRWNVGYFHDRVCSCCLRPDGYVDTPAHNYCPHCGAKMDGGDDDGKR